MNTITETENKKENSPNTSWMLDPNLRFDPTPLYLRQGLTEKNMEALYFLAHRLFEQHKYQKAAPFFQLMAFLNYYDKRAWLGIAACFEAMKQYSIAIGCYGCAAMLDKSDPMPFFRNFNCYLENKNREKALTSLEAAIERAEQQEHLYGNLKEQALKIKESLLQ